MSGRGRRTRAKWIAVLTAFAALAVGFIGIRHGVRFVRESQAIAALRSPDERQREAAIRELVRLGSPRAVLGLLGSLSLEEKDADEADTKAGAESVVDAELWLQQGGDTTIVLEYCEQVCATGMGAIGNRAVTALRSRLGSPEPAERYWSLHFLWRLPELSRWGIGPELRSLLDDPDEHVRREAVSATAFTAVTSPPAFEELLLELKRATSSERERAAIAEALALAVLVALRREALEWLDGHSPPVGGLERGQAMARSASLALMEAAEDPSLTLRRECIRGLHAIEDRWSLYLPEVRELDGLDIPRSIRRLLRLWLGAEDPATRLLGLQSMDRWGWDPDERSEVLPHDVLELMARCLSDPDRGIRDLAAEGLACEEAIPVLVGVLQRGDSGSRLRARNVLEKTGESLGAAKVWQRVFSLIGTSDESIVRLEVDLLSSLGEKDGIGIDRLVAALESKEPGVRRTATGVLERYRDADSFDDDGLVALLDDEDEEVRSYAVLALSWSRKLRIPTREEVARALMVAGPAALRRAACRAAKDLGPAAKDSVPMLVSLIEAKPWEGQESAAEALGAMGPAAAKALPALLAATERADPELTSEALDALCRISPDAGIPAASRALEHESGRVRHAALTALWGLGSEAAAAIPALRKRAADEEDPLIAGRAARLIRLIEGSAGRRSTERR